MTGHLLYTEEDVELVRACLPIDYDDYMARAVLTALSSANRLVPPGGIGRTEWLVTGKRRQQIPCFSEEEARTVAQMTGGRIRTRQTMAWPGGAVYASGWSDWSPSVPDTEEGT